MTLKVAGSITLLLVVGGPGAWAAEGQSGGKSTTVGKVKVQSAAHCLDSSVDRGLEPNKDGEGPGRSTDERSTSGNSKQTKDAHLPAGPKTQSLTEPGLLGNEVLSKSTSPPSPAAAPQEAGFRVPQIPFDQSHGWVSVVLFDPKIILVGAGGLLLLMFLVFARRRAKLKEETEGWEDIKDPDLDTLESTENAVDSAMNRWRMADIQTGPNDLSGSNGSSPQRKSTARANVATPASLFGAYQVDQEVGKLVLGQGHRMDVLSSRAPEDRRAIETSLLKVLNSSGSDKDECRRARAALEEYGFVAQQSAFLLSAADPYERTSAARVLGDIKSPASLPFLLEALYDSDSLVRNQAVLSIGELKLPLAIGALLDIARKNSDLADETLRKALSACSIGPTDSIASNEQSLFFSYPAPYAYEITHLGPALYVEPLRKSGPEKRLSEALAKIRSEQENERAEAVKTLAQFAVQDAVTELTATAQSDPEKGVRALAISSLATINHASIFPAVLIGMADEAREVRAAAARSLSRLSFDRADAYAWVMETCAEHVVESVARACIKAEIFSRHIERLVDCDPRQAYEAFALVCLLAKAKLIEPILQVISSHPNMEVRLIVAHLLAATGEPQGRDELCKMALKQDLSEQAREGLLQVIQKFERPNEADNLSDAAALGDGSEHQSSDARKTATSEEIAARVTALTELAHLDHDCSFREITRAFDDRSVEVRNAAARALYHLGPDPGAWLAQALREAPPERRRRIGAAVATSGLANNAIRNLVGKGRRKRYDAVSLLFLMAKTGEVQPLIRAIHEHQNVEARLALIRILMLCGRPEVVPAFSRVAVSGNLPSRVRSAAMEAIHQISPLGPVDHIPVT